MTARSSILTELQLTVSATSLYRRSKINLTRARKLKMVYIVGRKKKRKQRKKKEGKKLGKKKSNEDIVDRNCRHIEFQTSIRLITHIWQDRILTAQLLKSKQNLRSSNIGIDRSCSRERERESETLFQKCFLTGKQLEYVYHH